MGTESIDGYLRDVAKIPALSANEEEKLRERIRGGDERARDRLVEGSLLLALAMARRKARQVGFRHLHDLICEANLNLVRLGSSFDPDHPQPFGVCVYFTLRQRLSRAAGRLMQPVRVPRTVNDLRIAEHAARRDLRQRLRREPTCDELACELRVPTSRLERAVRAYVAPVELDDPDAFTLPGSEPSPEALALRSADAGRILSAIRRLKPRYRQDTGAAFRPGERFARHLRRDRRRARREPAVRLPGMSAGAGPAGQDDRGGVSGRSAQNLQPTIAWILRRSPKPRFSSPNISAPPFNSKITPPLTCSAISTFVSLLSLGPS